MEKVFEENTSLKFEKLAEVKANYDMMLKLLKPTDEKQAAKIDSIKKKREEAIDAVKVDMEALKKQKVDDIKKETEAKKKELHEHRDAALATLQQQESTRRKTKVDQNRQRIDTIKRTQSMFYGGGDSTLRSGGITSASSSFQ